MMGSKTDEETAFDVKAPDSNTLVSGQIILVFTCTRIRPTPYFLTVSQEGIVILFLCT